MKLLDLIGLNPIKPLIAYGGDGGGGGGGDDDDRYIDPYEEMDRNPQNYADPNYGGGGDGPPVAQTPVVVPEVYVPPAVVTLPLLLFAHNCGQRFWIRPLRITKGIT